jgi:HSP20 family protein
MSTAHLNSARTTVRSRWTDDRTPWTADHAIMSPVLEFSFLPTIESRELADDLRQVFADLAATLSPEQRAYSGEYHPALDVVETASAVEIVVDVAGVPAVAVRVLFRGDVLIIAGEKAPPPSTSEPNFHLLERGFGRFVRAVRLSGAFELAQAQAKLSAGELTIILPKRLDRRGQAQTIRVESDSRRPA